MSRQQDVSYDVFISYRRSGDGYAISMRLGLEKRGIKTFLDTDLGPGLFDESLLKRIEETPAFLVILTEHSLDRCSEADDWLRKEIVHALATKRIIIPIMFPPFRFSPQLVRNLDPVIQELARYQGIEFSRIYFENTIQRTVDLIEQGKVVQEQAERQRRAMEQAERERQALQKAEEERQLEAVRLENERLEKERLAAEEAERQRRAMEQAERERQALQKAKEERQKQLEATRLENERLEKERLEKERLAAEEAEQQRRAMEQAERERQALQKAEEERQKQLEAARLENERLGKERLSAEKAERERRAHAKAEVKRKKREKRYSQRRRKRINMATWLQERPAVIKEHLISAKEMWFHFWCQPEVSQAIRFLKAALPLTVLAGVGSIPLGYLLPSAHSLAIARIWVLLATWLAIWVVYRLQNSAGILTQRLWYITFSVYFLFAAVGWAFPSTHLQHGYWLYTKGYQKLGILDYRIGTFLSPKNIDAHNWLGWVLLGKGDRSGAAREFRKALLLDPNFFSAHSGLANLDNQSGNFDEAVKEFQECLRIKPDSAEAHDGLGFALKSQGNFAAAVDEYREASRLQPNDVDKHYWLGVFLAEHGNADDALKEYREALRLNPQFQPASNGISILEEQRSRSGNQATKGTGASQ